MWFHVPNLKSLEKGKDERCSSDVFLPLVSIIEAGKSLWASKIFGAFVTFISPFTQKNGKEGQFILPWKPQAFFPCRKTALWIDLPNIKSWWKICRLGVRQVIITVVYAMPEAPVSLLPAAATLSINAAIALSSLSPHLFSTFSCPIP